MNDEIQALIDSLRRGQYEDPREKISLLSAALQEGKADVPFLLSLLRAPQIPLRLAALDACRERPEPDLLAELALLVDHSDARARLKLAEVLCGRQQKLARETLQTLLGDADEDVREAACKSTSGQPEFQAAQEKALAGDPDWEVRLAAANALDAQKNPAAAKPLLLAVGRDDDADVRRRCAELVERRLNEDPEQNRAEQHLPTEIAPLARVERNLKQLGGQRFPKLMAWLTARTAAGVDPAALAEFGTDLTALALSETLPRAYGIQRHCDILLKLLQREPARSVALLGPTGVGKSALVNQLVYELLKPENGAWRVLRVSPTDFMAGTRYLGEWETRIRELVEAIRKPRRVLLYVPNLSDLSAAGTWSKSQSSVATALVPYMEEGSVLLLGESTAEEFEQGLGRIPSLQRAFDKLLLTESSVETTREILQSVRAAEGSNISEVVLEQMLDVSGQFLGHISRPGNAVELLRSVIKSEKESGAAVTYRHVLESLSKSTGVPVDLLDDAVPLNPAELREFFDRKIIGQPEATDAVVDLITLIKAGLTDPGKPFAIFLFVGPTGVGKTELARALAEYIFGDASRLRRFDMSEFAHVDGFTRLIGRANENGLLTDPIRQHPFSVVLLDEIEKSHVNVFDLCLQIFDAGRLTDGRGRTVDFRRTIVILTSNVGATAPSTPLGFAAGDSGAADVDRDRTFRELSRFFRPEFLNRIDRIIQFRPLSLQVAEQIARREIDLMLQRSGIRRRHLTIEVDPAVLSLLIREGYSPHFGARPLKRTIERMLLLPVARAISSGSLRGRTILRLTARDNRVEAAITGSATPARPTAAAQVLAPTSVQQTLTELLAAYGALETAVIPLADRKSELLLRMSEPQFHRQTADRGAVFDEIHKLEQFLSLHDGLGKVLSGIETRLRHKPLNPIDEGPLREKLTQLRAELDHLRLVARSQNAQDLGDAIVSLSLVDRRGAPQSAVAKLAEMYRCLATRRRMTAEVLGEFYDEKHDLAHLLISGLGAYALFKNESGLHQVDQRYKQHTPRSGREVLRENRELVRVETLPAPLEPSKQFKQKVKAKISPLKPGKERLARTDFLVSLFHEELLRGIEIWTAGPKNDALARAHLLLSAHTQRSDASPNRDAVIRQYDVGLSPRVKDCRTGRATSQVDQIFKGALGPWLLLEG
ncbi:MAG TPA: AAA family ATPase [Verrucomicrobiae bacterium]|nr:AAA family ATPase [Verrucomicrobiae bacterium]